MTRGELGAGERLALRDAAAKGLGHPGRGRARVDWRYMLRGRGALEPLPAGLRLVDEGAEARAYTNAQIDDYQGLPRRDFLWRPPLTLTVRARFSHPGADQAGDGGLSLLGTAGFGFWNDPFLMTDRRPPALPRALWFFYASPPSDMKLDLNTPGWGWKAATIDAARWPVRLCLPLAPLAVPLMHSGSIYRRSWPLAQRMMNICEAPVEAPMTEWHKYEIEWRRDGVRFAVDGGDVLSCDRSPRGPLGLVLWIDNQYMVATPRGRFRYGMLDVPWRQWLELDQVAVS